MARLLRLAALAVVLVSLAGCFGGGVKHPIKPPNASIQLLEVEPDGLVLTEVAKGIDVQRDVLEQMAFRPKRIAENLKLMEAELFAD